MDRIVIKMRITSIVVVLAVFSICHCSALVDLGGLDVPGAPDGGAADSAAGASCGPNAPCGDGSAASDGAIADAGAHDAAVETGAVRADGGATDAGKPASDADTGDAGGDGCVIVTHSNGVGQTWQDCLPLGTHTQAEANKACSARANSGCAPSTGCNLSFVAVSTANAQYYWVYATTGQTSISPGDVLQYSSSMSISCQNVRASHNWQ